jgi:putative spermidine/putrescine transport system permease protein
MTMSLDTRTLVTAAGRGPRKGAARPATRPGGRTTWLLLIPAVAVVATYFLVPLGQTIVRSFTDPQVGVQNYVTLLTDGVTLTVIGRTLGVALLVTVITLVLAYPYAYAMTKAGPTGRAIMLALALLPFWTSLLARNFAWILLLQDGGPLHSFFAVFGLDVVLYGTLPGVAIAMSQVLLPYMILPLYSSMQSIDRRLLTAGRSLGATPVRAFARVYLPLSLPGVVAGTLLVFVLALGFYVTPALVGSPQQSLVAQLLASRTRELVDFGGAGALGTVVLVLAMVLLLVISRFGRGAGAVGVAAGAATGGNGRSTNGWGGRIAVVIVGIILLAPTLVVIPMSFSAGNTFQFPPSEWSIRWYESFFTSVKWQRALQNSITIGLIVMVVATVLGTAASIAIHRHRGRRLAAAGQGLLTLPLAVPNIVIAVAIYMVFLQWGLSGSVLGFVMAHTVLAIPFVLVAVGASLSQFDRRLTDAGASLGAAPPSVFRRITLPLILPGVLSGAVFAFVTSFDEVVVALFLKSPRLTTLPALMYDSVTLEIDPTIAAASSIVVVATSLVILIPQLIQNVRARKKAAS